MQGATNDCGSESGPSVQADPDGAVRAVVQCDRCPRELRSSRPTVIGRVEEVGPEYRTRWTLCAVQTGMAPVKEMTLCPECTRGLRLFMLGATAPTVRISERWEAVVSEAV